jgi:PIN domain nuclease of toxin-antitoxin system
VDTHALIWYLLGDKKLSPSALAIFKAAEQGKTRLVISVIVLAELYYANARNGWFSDYATAFRMIASKPYFTVLPIHPHHILDFDQDSASLEMHDRIIVGVARRLNASLISSDRVITAAGVVKVIW